MSDEPTGQIIGIILYAAISPDYVIRSIIFTDKEVLQVPISRIGELAQRMSGLPVVAAWLLEAVNPAVFSGLGGLVGIKMWSDLKKKVANQQPVKFIGAPIPPDIEEEAKFKLSYGDIRRVKISKIAMSTDYLLSLTAGFLHTQMIVFEGRAVEDVTSLVNKTPLSSKLS
jgi:hypothetical protein